MLSIKEKIHQETQNIPENLALQVYDFICFIKARYSYQLHEKQIYQDKTDVYEAEQALKEEGGISLTELKAKYEL